MRLIGLTVVLAVGLALAPLAVEAQQVGGKVYRVGIIATTPVAGIMRDPAHPFNSGFRREMRDRGYAEGQNFILELRSVEGKMERASEVVAELIRPGPPEIASSTSRVESSLSRCRARVRACIP